MRSARHWPSLQPYADIRRSRLAPLRAPHTRAGCPRRGELSDTAGANSRARRHRGGVRTSHESD